VVGVAAVVAGAVTYTSASHKLDAIRADATAGRPYDEMNGNWQTLDRLGVALLVSGTIVTTTGAVVYVSNRAMPSPRPAEDRVAVAPFGWAGLQIRGSF
jgi:hypothetical protein